MSSGISDKQVIASLYDKNQNMASEFNSKILQDICGDKQAYFTAKDFDSTDLFINSTLVQPNINSSVLFDEDCNYYYFRQEKDQRSLYKNEQKLFTIKGFAGKITDVKNGKIYFIAPTKLGSGLFEFSNKISQVFQADNIIDAKHIRDDEFLISTVCGDGYYIMTARADPKPTLPSFWEYNLSQNSKEIFFSKKTPEYPKKSYNHVLSLQYGHLHPEFLSSEDGYQLSIDAFFTDFLQENSITLSYIENKNEGKDKNYENSVGILYNLYQKSFWFKYNRFINSNKNERDFFAQFFIGYPLSIKSTHVASLNFSKYYDAKYKNIENVFGGISYKYSLQFPLSNFADTSYNFEVNFAEQKTASLGIGLQKSFFDFLGIEANAKASNSKTNTIKISKKPFEVNPINKIFLNINSPLFTDRFINFNAGLDIALDLSYYNTSVLSLKNIHLIGLHDHLWFKNIYYPSLNIAQENDNFKHEIEENAFGAKFILLFARKFKLPIEVLGVKNSTRKDLGIFVGVEGNF